MRSLTPHAPDGAGEFHYSAALKTPANDAFVHAYRARFTKVPSYYSESMYTGGKWLVAAINAIDGHVEDRAALLDAIRKARPSDLPRGLWSSMRTAIRSRTCTSAESSA